MDRDGQPLLLASIIERSSPNDPLWLSTVIHMDDMPVIRFTGCLVDPKPRTSSVHSVETASRSLARIRG